MNYRLLVIMIASVQTCYSQNSSRHRLWYYKPSGTARENALPLGKPQADAMRCGNAGTETTRFNEHSLRTMSSNRYDNPPGKDALGKIKKLIFRARRKMTENPASGSIAGKDSQKQMFEPAGELHLVFAGINYSSDRREPVIEKAFEKTLFKNGDISDTCKNPYPF